MKKDVGEKAVVAEALANKDKIILQSYHIKVSLKK